MIATIAFPPPHGGTLIRNKLSAGPHSAAGCMYVSPWPTNSPEPSSLKLRPYCEEHLSNYSTSTLCAASDSPSRRLLYPTT